MSKLERDIERTEKELREVEARLLSLKEEKRLEDFRVKITGIKPIDERLPVV